MKAALREHVVAHPSPNFNDRPDGASIDTLIMHYTEMDSAESALERMCDPEIGVSAHYLIHKNGTIYQLVDDHKRAWHAGVSGWRGKEQINHYSIGFEIDNNGSEPFSSVQMEAICQLSHWVMKHFPIEQRNVIGHSDIAPNRKADPGKYFDWAMLASKNIGICPTIEAQSTTATLLPGDKGHNVTDLQTRLAAWGYPISITGHYDKATEDVVTAFRLHYLQHHLEQQWDQTADTMLNALLNEVSHV